MISNSFVFDSFKEFPLICGNIHIALVDESVCIRPNCIKLSDLISYPNFVIWQKAIDWKVKCGDLYISPIILADYILCIKKVMGCLLYDSENYNLISYYGINRFKIPISYTFGYDTIKINFPEPYIEGLNIIPEPLYKKALRELTKNI